MKRCCGFILAVWLGLHSPAAGDWYLDFNDGTLQGLNVVDPYGNSFTVSNVNGSIRFQSNNNGSDNEAALAVHPEVFTDISARVLIRYSTNPNLGPPGTKMNGGLFVHLNLATVSGYVLVMNDWGFLQLYKVVGGAVCYAPQCPQSLLQDVPLFTPRLDWWMRFEAVNEPEGVRLRGRAWPDGDPEPCEWQVEMLDTKNVFTSGMVALVGDEDKNGYYIDLDEASVSTQMSCLEICGNGQDDDGDGRIDCYDSDCSDAPECACNTPFADADGDGDVDMDDFGWLQRCISGEGRSAGTKECACFDRDDLNASGSFERDQDGDGDVDADDVAAFVACSSGPSVPADPHCGE